MVLLFVDDEEDLRELCIESFQEEGIECLGCGCAEEAMELIKKNKSTLKVILSDDKMPGIRGREMFSKISSEIKDISFYLCTGDMEVEEDQLIKMGMKGVISKPYDIDQLILKVKNENNL